MDDHSYPEWQSLLDELSLAKGVIAVVGPTDTGKTTFCSLLANRLIDAGSAVPIVDADIGQAEIGPPGVISLGIADRPFARLGDLSPRAMSFVGTTSPARNPSASIVGAARMVARARQEEAPLVLVDTSGLVHGGPARFLKLAKLDIIAPSHIVALQRNTEMMPLVHALDARENWKVHRASVPSVISLKPQHVRAQRRSARLQLYFRNAAVHTLALDEVALIGSRLGSGQSLPPERVKRAATICRRPVLAAERAGDHLSLVMNEEPDEASLAFLKREFAARSVSIIRPAMLQGLMVGLTDERGTTFGAGILLGIDFAERRIRLRAPVTSVLPVRWLRLGMMRLCADGAEFGELKPWQV